MVSQALASVGAISDTSLQAMSGRMLDFCYPVGMDEVKDLRMRLVNAIRILDQMDALLRDARASSPAIMDPLIRQLVKKQKLLRRVIEKWQRRIDEQEEP